MAKFSVDVDIDGIDKAQAAAAIKAKLIGKLGIVAEHTDDEALSIFASHSIAQDVNEHVEAVAVDAARAGVVKIRPTIPVKEVSPIEAAPAEPLSATTTKGK